MLGVLLFAALLLISGCDSDGETTHNGTGDNNEMPQTIHAAIVFIAAKDSAGINDLYAATRDGTAVVKLSGSLALDADVTTFSVSPDGTRVAFGVAHNARAGQQELFVVNTAGGEPVRLSDLAISIDHGHRYAWSPDSRYLAFIATTGLWTIRSDGADRTRIAGEDPMNVVWNVTWAPIGLQLAYEENQELFTVFHDGSGKVRVGEHLPGLSPLLYRWAHDGAHLGYADQDMLFTVLPNGTNRLAVARISLFSNISGTEVAFFSWSPDSTRIAYISRPPMAEIFVALAAGGGEIKLSGPRVLGPFVWSPDGTWIAYRAAQESSHRLFELYTARTDGSNTAKISDPLPANGAVLCFDWAPDGARIAYVADEETDDVFELYTVTPDGRNKAKVSGPLPFFSAPISGVTASCGPGLLPVVKWAPDGARIAYVADEETDDVFELYTVTPDGRNKAKVSGSLVAGGDVLSFAWSSDSSRLIYCADQETNDVFALYDTSPTGTGTVKISGSLGASGSVDCYTFRLLN